MATYHELLFKMGETKREIADAPPSDPQPPPLVRSRRLSEKRQPPSDAKPTWADGARYATDLYEVLGK